MTPAAFAIPGEITTKTGGYIYERRLLEALRATGRSVEHLKFGASFPDPTARDIAAAAAALRRLPCGMPVILDGFVSATMDRDTLAGLPLRFIAMVHHPLALEAGLTNRQKERLYTLEYDNLKHMSHVFVPSPHTAQILGSQYRVPRDKITVLRPGCDFSPLPQAPSTPPLILSVGLLHPRKGHDVLLEALALIADLPWTAVIAGKPHDPEYASALATKMAELQLSERVVLAGLVSDGDLAELYAKASIFALATRYEGYGLVFDEALASGLPIVSCKTGAVPDTVPAGAGALVHADDPPAFASALRRILTSPAIRQSMADAAQEAGRALPSWAQTAGLAGSVVDRLAGDPAIAASQGSSRA